METQLVQSSMSTIFDLSEHMRCSSGLRHDGPFPLQHEAPRTIPAVPRAERRFVSAMRIWISAARRSGHQPLNAFGPAGIVRGA